MKQKTIKDINSVEQMLNDGLHVGFNTRAFETQS